MDNTKTVLEKDALSKVVDAVCALYREQYENRIVHILMYGSYARGDNADGSDLDMVAIVDGERQELQDRLKAVWSATASLGFDNDIIISPAVIPKEEFEEYKDVLPYYKNIVNEGVYVG